MFVRAGWDENKPTPFAVKGRNAEDLGVEIFSKSPVLNFSFPIITENWALNIEPGDESPCSYDWSTYRYCAQLKTVIRSSSNPKVLKPTMAFTVTAACGDAPEQTSGSAGAAAINVVAFDRDGDKLDGKLATVQLEGGCDGGRFHASGAASRSFAGDAEWVVATVANSGGVSLEGVELRVRYLNSEAVAE